MKKKNVKMNLTFTQEFYKFLKKKASDEHLAVSTFVKKFLMDIMLKNNRKENNYEKI